MIKNSTNNKPRSKQKNTSQPNRNRPNRNRPNKTENRSKELATTNTKEPLFYVAVESIDPDKGLKFVTDWSPVLIHYLRANGFTGTGDESIIQKFVAGLYAEVQERILLENNIRSDFE